MDINKSTLINYDNFLYFKNKSLCLELSKKIKCSKMRKSIYVSTIVCCSLLIAGCNNAASEKEKNIKKQSQQVKQKPAVQQKNYPKAYFDAAFKGDLSTVKDAIDAGLGVNTTDKDGTTGLMLAGYNGRDNVVEYLLQQGAKVNLKDANGRTALIYAASGNNAKSVKMLLDEGSEINHTDKVEGFTALMFAASEGQKDVVKILLDAGADKTIKDKDGETAHDFAVNNGHPATAKLLED